MWRYWIILTVVWGLVACGRDEPLKQDLSVEQTPMTTPKSPTEALKAVDQSLANAGKITNPEDIKFTTVPFEYLPPKAVRDVCQIAPQDDGIGCPSVDVELTKVNPVWIEQRLNHVITRDDNPQRIKFKQGLDDFALRQINEESPMAYHMSIKPEYLGGYKQVAQFSIAKDTYLGGAHGMPTLHYYLFDMKLQSQITLEDILLDDADLYTPLYQKFIRYLADEMEITKPKEIAEYEAMWSLELTENVYFGQTGLVFVYQPYELGSFAQGFIELTVPYDELTDMLKPAYLPTQDKPSQ